MSIVCAVSHFHAQNSKSKGHQIGRQFDGHALESIFEPFSARFRSNSKSDSRPLYPIDLRILRS